MYNMDELKAIHDELVKDLETAAKLDSMSASDNMGTVREVELVSRSKRIKHFLEVIQRVYNDFLNKEKEQQQNHNKYVQDVAKLEFEMKRNESDRIWIDNQKKTNEKQLKKLRKIESDLNEREVALNERENAIEAREKNEKISIKKLEIEAKANFEKELAEERIKALDSLKKDLEKQRQIFEETITKRDKDSKEAIDAQLAKKIGEVEADIKTRRENAEIEIKTKFLEAENTIKARIEEETKLVTEQNEKLKGLISLNEQLKEKLYNRETELDKRNSELQVLKASNERAQRRISQKEEELETQENEIDELVNQRYTEQVANLRNQIEKKDEALQDLRNQVSELIKQKEEIDTFKVSIGGDPLIIKDKIYHLNKNIEELHDELAKRAPAEIKAERDALRVECDSLKGVVASLQSEKNHLSQKNEELTGFEIENIGLTNKNEQLESLVKQLQSQAEDYRNRIERLSSKEARLSDREERISEIKKGYLKDLVGENLEITKTEVEWLDEIYQQCDDYGIRFPRRILYAFHTALKISDWSTITVLAGVSGTGKSELPRLYAAFGGLNFLNVPVQPSWDSQESMLGFFNSIDNRFEPEPLLRFLVQCTEDQKYSQFMSIVLLDEMNLAHIEHYFADFLSKLEMRRGIREVPAVEVKLGAGVKPYELKLERSILWTGTMNQDETTKSLSDKVLDRGLVINFPRPRILISRKGMKDLERTVQKLNRPMLTSSTWSKWITKTNDLIGDQKNELDSYKKIVEEINDVLEGVGRALGHRVWQSIEHYIINYPTVTAAISKLSNGEMSNELKEAMRVAFEDQIVQKIMPKLRGVETRGRGKENLDRIEALLENKGFERLKDDFEIACEQGYGQFIWSSAKYIEADDEEQQSKKAVDADKQ